MTAIEGLLGRSFFIVVPSGVQKINTTNKSDIQ